MVDDVHGKNCSAAVKFTMAVVKKCYSLWRGVLFVGWDFLLVDFRAIPFLSLPHATHTYLLKKKEKMKSLFHNFFELPLSFPPPSSKLTISLSLSFWLLYSWEVAVCTTVCETAWTKHHATLGGNFKPSHVRYQNNKINSNNNNNNTGGK